MTSPARCTTTVSPTRTSLPRDFVLVVQRGVGDDDAADGDRPQFGDRRQRAGAADLDLDRFDDRRRALGGKFVRHRPARAARDEAEPLLQREIVDLVDDAVDVVAERRPLRFDRAVMAEHLGRRMAELVSGLTGRPKRLNASIAPFCVVAIGSLSSPQA